MTVPDGQRADAPTTATLPPAAETAKAVKFDKVTEMLNPAARKLLASRPTPPSKELPPTQPETKPTIKPEPAKPGDDAKPDEPTPDAGVIDFSELGQAVTPAEDGETPTEPTDIELADLDVVKKKIKEAHKENATLRKQRREDREAKDAAMAELTKLKEELATVQASKASASQSYLDRFTKTEEVDSAYADAMAALQGFAKDADADFVMLPGERRWELSTDESRAGAKSLALEIVSGYNAKMKQLGQRADADKLVTEKLPLLTKSVPDFESRYKKTLTLDWASEAPRISLNAALGELVVSGDYVLVPRKAAAQKPAPKTEAKPTLGELPKEQPPVREATEGPDLKDLKDKALKGGKEGQKALQEWIRLNPKAAPKKR